MAVLFLTWPKPTLKPFRLLWDSIQVLPFPAISYNICQLIQLLPKQLGAKDSRFFGRLYEGWNFPQGRSRHLLSVEMIGWHGFNNSAWFSSVCKLNCS
jgi:hypothetical protein